jgi:hypothetical protein
MLSPDTLLVGGFYRISRLNRNHVRIELAREGGGGGEGLLDQKT